MSDSFATFHSSLTSPAEGALAVTPADGTDLARTARAVWVGGTGDLRVTMLSGDIATFTGVPGGSLLPFRVRRVMATGTTATGIVALV